MDTLGKLVGLAMVPIMILNTLGGILAGIWLALLGEWWALAVGIFAIFVTHGLLAIAFLPGLLLAAPAAMLLHKDRLAPALPLLALSQLYHVGVIVLWCAGVLAFFLQDASPGSFIPLLIWSYGVALGPVMFLASKEAHGGGGEGALYLTFFAQVAFIATMVVVLLLPLSLLGVVLLMTAILLIGTGFQLALAVRVHRADSLEREGLAPPW